MISDMEINGAESTSVMCDKLGPSAPIACSTLTATLASKLESGDDFLCIEFTYL
jgi:hypothetical protein